MILSFASIAHPQNLTKIVATSVGTPVMLEMRSVSRASGIDTATVRAALQPAIKTPKGDYKSARSIAMFDCVKRTVATKELCGPP